jgi:hypothetical protein
MSEIRVPVSVGELIDKITILEIKSERIKDPAKLDNVRRELGLLQATWDASPLSDQDVGELKAELKEVNETLWEIEDFIRVKEMERAFDEQFIELARSVYVNNDRRAALKRQLNEATGSTLVEEKDYPDYADAD